MNGPDPIPAPVDAIAWALDAGFLYDDLEVARHVERGDVVLVVSDDGMVRGVTATDSAPLRALLRVEGDLTDVVQRLDELADDILRRIRTDNLTTAENVVALQRQVDAVAQQHAGLAARVSDLGDHVTAVGDSFAVELSTLKGRVRQLEQRPTL